MIKQEDTNVATINLDLVDAERDGEQIYYIFFWLRWSLMFFLISAWSKREMEATPAVNEDDRKLFVGGLPQEASDEDVKEYFGQYGEIENVNLKMDPQTGRSRGFAFIVFKDNDALNAASAQEAHVIKVNSILGQLLNKMY